MSKKQYLVIGGTGKTGRKVVQRLTEKGETVRIGSRSQPIPFDWEDPTTWEAALKGMHRVYITFQPDLAVPGARQAIESLMSMAATQGIEKVVLLSGKGEEEAERSEQIVKSSGIDWTIVRASWFNQNFSESFFLEPILAGQVALPQAHAQVPYVDTEDIADVVVAALTDDQHNGQTYELTGPRTLSFPQVISEIGRATGRDIEFQAVSMETYMEMLKSLQLPEDYLWLIEYLFTNVLPKKDNSVITNDIEKVLGRKPKDFTHYATEVASQGIWNPVLT